NRAKNRLALYLLARRTNLPTVPSWTWSILLLASRPPSSPANSSPRAPLAPPLLPLPRQQLGHPDSDALLRASAPQCCGYPHVAPPHLPPPLARSRSLHSFRAHLRPAPPHRTPVSRLGPHPRSPAASQSQSRHPALASFVPRTHPAPRHSAR